MNKIHFLHIMEGWVKDHDKFNALHKVPADVARAAQSMGAKEAILFKRTTKYKLVNTVKDYKRVLALCSHIRNELKHGDYFVVQNRISLPKMRRIARAVRSVGAKIVFLIYDIDFLRYDGDSDFTVKRARIELNRMKYADGIIVHTPAMKELLEKLGVRAKMSILYLFDYFTDGTETQKLAAGNPKEVAFAGNLSIRAFLKPLNTQQWENVEFNLYGFEKPDFLDNKAIHYRGLFTPENVSDIDGGWGLVWDGDSIDTCDGLLGNYMKYTTSHKTSLYLVAGLPLIIWSQSSLKDYVIENGIGITVDSISRLEELIPSITAEEYEAMRRNVKVVGDKLRAGIMFREAMERLTADLQ